MLGGIEFELGGRRVRQHMIKREPGGLVRVDLAGDVTEADVQRIAVEILQPSAPRGSLSLLVDITRLGTMSAGARRAGLHADLSAYRALALVGASYRMTVLIGLMQRAFELIFRHPTVPTRLCATDAEALAWFAKQRQANEAERRA